MLKRILLLLGETPSSQAAQQFALRLAKKDKAQLVGLDGVDLPHIDSPMPGSIGAASYRIMLEEKLLAKAAETRERLRATFEADCLKNDIAFESLSFEGDATEAVQMALETRDLVVTGHDTAFRGNEAEALSETLAKLLVLSARPLIVCPDKPTTGDEVLIAYDGSVPAMRAVQLYALLQAGSGVRVQVLSVDESEDVAARRVNGAADYLGTHGFSVEAVPIATKVSPTEVLKIEISHRKVGTLVIGAYGRRGLRELLFGSTTTALVEDPPCALFLYH
jgi:nucleotide-binding universal stress UspA family protein